MVKRAITLAGGGPAVGLSIGALKKLNEEGIKFDIWATACIGAWLTSAYWQSDAESDEGRLNDAIDIFKQIFRPDDTYSRFPIATPFAPNYVAGLQNMVGYVTNPNSYHNLIVPEAIKDSAEVVFGFMTDPKKWNIADFNSMILNGLMAGNPFARFMVGAIYQQPTNGMSRIFYPESSFIKSFNWDNLKKADRPFIYHNAYNLTKQRLELFTNRPGEARHEHLNMGQMTAQSVCACSALPYIEEPIYMNDDVYCEGATIDTVNFKDICEIHDDLDEIWVSRILDTHQIHAPQNLYDALNNLVMLFAATVSEDDVRLFKFHAKECHPNLKIIEIPVAADINYDWNYGNLEDSINDGYKATELALTKLRAAEELEAAKKANAPEAKTSAETAAKKPAPSRTAAKPAAE